MRTSEDGLIWAVFRRWDRVAPPRPPAAGKMAMVFGMLVNWCKLNGLDGVRY